MPRSRIRPSSTPRARSAPRRSSRGCRRWRSRRWDELGLEEWSPSDLLGISSVSSSPDSDILTFTVKSEDRKLAVPLATAYARQFTRYKRELDTQTIAELQQQVEEQLNELESEGNTDSPQYQTLVAQSDKLQSLVALQTARAVLVRPATAAVQVEPQPVRNAILGIALGLFLGLGLAALLEALDSRVRSARKVGAELQLPVLARIARPPRALRMHDRLVMLADPTGPHAEAFRMLRTNIELARADTQLRTIMVTSAVKNEGKSTTIANLAVACRARRPECDARRSRPARSAPRPVLRHRP